MELALFTGKPHFSVQQHVGGPIVEPETKRRFHELADEAFARNYLTNYGPLSLRLEREVAARHRVADAVFMANATLAQMVLMKVMGLDGGEALVSANTFIATAHVCEWLGVKPVFCDIDPATLNMCPRDAERRITRATTAIIPTHVFGVLADMPAFVELARKNGLLLLADAAHAFDCDRGGVPPGGYGVPEFLSFHATKFFSTVEGGAVLTNDAVLARELREARNFGFVTPGDAEKIGTNAKASEISAAFGLASLPAVEERRRRLKSVRDAYIEELSGVPGLTIHDIDGAGKNNYRYFALFVDAAFGLDRDMVYEALLRENVLARLYFHPGCHRMGYYRERETVSLPEADKALGRIISLPTSFPNLDEIESAKAISGILKELHRKADDARRVLAGQS
jgi:Predicted pyridoxal phosphate-dependent enzyme apparently involved in regulation of cell wall biogenesis